MRLRPTTSRLPLAPEGLRPRDERPGIPCGRGKVFVPRSEEAQQARGAPVRFAGARRLCPGHTDPTGPLERALGWFRIRVEGEPTPIRGRRGAVLMAALVYLVLALMVLGSLMGLASARRARARMEERRLQAEWLAESGLERAAAKLAAAPDYRGETWEPAAADLGGRDGGLVRIEVGPVENRPRRRHARAVAEYPRDSDRRARHTEHATIDLDAPPRPEPTTGDGRR